jgi:hypothetical protein
LTCGGDWEGYRLVYKEARGAREGNETILTTAPD